MNVSFIIVGFSGEEISDLVILEGVEGIVTLELFNLNRESAWKGAEKH